MQSHRARNLRRALDPETDPRRKFPASQGPKGTHQLDSSVHPHRHAVNSPDKRVATTADHLRLIRVGESSIESIPRQRVLSVRFNPSGNDCIEFLPHFAEAILIAAVRKPRKTHCAQAVARVFNAWRKFWPGKGRLGPDQIQGLFEDALLAMFADKLGRAGWFKATQQQREEAGFRLTEMTLCHVDTDFPRILRKNLQNFGPGVDVKKYTVDLNVCMKFALKDPAVAQLWQPLSVPVDISKP